MIFVIAGLIFGFLTWYMIVKERPLMMLDNQPDRDAYFGFEPDSEDDA